MGIPNSSPPVFWPRGMSVEALSPENLYPNGPQFGLGNTSGGFGSYGSGPISGVGLAQRALPTLMSEELEHPYFFVRRMYLLDSAEALKSHALFASILAGRGSSAANQAQPFKTQFYLSSPYSSALTDSILYDRPASVDTILNSKF
jgi:hypothetical protein